MAKKNPTASEQIAVSCIIKVPAPAMKTPAMAIPQRH